MHILPTNKRSLYSMAGEDGQLKELSFARLVGFDQCFGIVGRASPMPNQREAPNVARHVAGPDDELGPLPEGWEERVHTDGRIFFIDHSKFLV